MVLLPQMLSGREILIVTHKAVQHAGTGSSAKAATPHGEPRLFWPGILTATLMVYTPGPLQTTSTSQALMHFSPQHTKAIGKCPYFNGTHKKKSYRETNLLKGTLAVDGRPGE